MSFAFFIRTLTSHSRALLIQFLGLLLIGALAASLPAYSAAISDEGLTNRLAAAPLAARNILISGNTLDEPLYTDIQEALGPVLVDRIDVRETEVGGQSVIHTENGEWPFDEYFALHPYAITNLADLVTVIEGRLPEANSSVIEAVVGTDSVSTLNFTTAVDSTNVERYILQVGDEVESADGQRVRVVGVVEPNEPEGDAWWGTLLPFRYLREPRNGNNLPETISLSLLVRTEDMLEAFPGHTRQWRLLTDTNQININNADDVQARLREIETQMTGSALQVDTFLIDLIGGYTAEMAASRVSLYLLASQALLFGLLALLLVNGDMIRRGDREATVLKSRGTSRTQLALLFAGTTLIAAVLAVLLAPPLARAVLSVWGEATQRPVAETISREAWVWCAVVVLVGWALLLLSYLVRLRHLPDTWSWERPQPPSKPFWERIYLDVILLLVGAGLYWQSTNGGTAALGMGGSQFSGGADPLLILGPTMLLVGLALAFLRLFPALVRWWSGRAARSSAPVTPYSLAHVGRDPHDASRLILIISLAVGLAVYAVLWESSLRQRQEEIAHYQAGADIRVTVPNSSGAAEVAQLAAVEGVETASPAYVNTRVRWTPELARLATLIAVDPTSFGDVAGFAPDISTLTLGDILPALQLPGSDAIPAVFSTDAFPLDRQVGDIVDYAIGPQRVNFEVRGLIQSFPTVSGAFIITNLDLLEQQVDLSLLGEPWVGRKEVWLDVEPGQAAALQSAIDDGQALESAMGTRSTADLLRNLQSDLVGQQTAAGFSLNGWSVSLIGLGAFALVFYFACRRRDNEFGVLRTMGYSTRQVTALLAVEGVAALVLGLIAGTAIGYALALMMRPVHSQTLNAAVGGDAIHQLSVNWPALALMLGLLTIGYLLALMLVVAVVTRRATLPDRQLALE